MVKLTTNDLNVFIYQYLQIHLGLSIFLSIYLSIKSFTKLRKFCHLQWIEGCTDAIKKTHPRPQNIWTG